MNDPFDVPLHDQELLDEVFILTDLIIACSDAAGPLTASQIDAALGLAAADPAVDRRLRPPVHQVAP
ncbi:MAG: hypothetical protein HOQ22_02100 [Nocardioidaceae bacterium]|nr:hypothetical protein [Nocardioidaceae bacterium]NUS49817.1 hypothetical protein [Nocardioidaceae bacterium]